MSAPAENASPAPVTITAFTASSALAWSRSEASSWSSASFMAFRASGLFRTMRAMPSRRSYSTGLAGMRFLLRGARVRHVLRNAVSERPVLLLYLDEVDEDVFRAHVELLPEPVRDGV